MRTIARYDGEVITMGGESLECDEMMSDLHCVGCLHYLDCEYEWNPDMCGEVC